MFVCACIPVFLLTVSSMLLFVISHFDIVQFISSDFDNIMSKVTPESLVECLTSMRHVHTCFT